MNKTRHSLTARTLRLAAVRIGMVSICAGIVSYFVNQSTLEEAVRAQLLLSTEQTIQREALPFREIRELEQNFLGEFKALDNDPAHRATLVRDFDQFFIRNADGSYTQRPGLFEGQSLADGRRFPNMSATYAPDIVPSDDVKARFALSFLLSYKYGSVTKGRVFNFYGPIPEKGFPIFQAADISKVFTYSGPEMLKLETYEFFAKGFDPAAQGTFLTRMYFDYSNNAWMTTVATPDTPDASGNHRILACVDILLDNLMQRLAHPTIQGAYSTLFLADGEGTLMFHPDHMAAIRDSEGHASIKSLKLQNDYLLLDVGMSLPPGGVTLVDIPGFIVAVGRIPETQAILCIHYPRDLMQPAILKNLAVVIALGLCTLLVEIFIIRSILQYQVALPLERLIRATRLLGTASPHPVDQSNLPIKSQDEIGELARAFASMADQVQYARTQLESKVQERTLKLEEANQKLEALSTTDELTGIANRRRFDEVLDEEWRRAKRSDSHLALTMIDVDWFKQYNDHYGHQAGDECLRRIAHLLQAVTHRAGDFVARYGGEEFALIATGTDENGGLAFAKTICAAVAQLRLPHEKSPFGLITISVGVASTISGAHESPDSLLKQADMALYRAKELGRNRVVLAPSERGNGHVDPDQEIHP